MNPPDIDPEGLSGNKIVRTFRMPRDLVHLLGREANQRGLDLTALVLRILHGFMSYFALPDAAIAQLEADREAMHMDRQQYLAHVLYHRCMAIREEGPGFDDPRTPPGPAPRAAQDAEAPGDRASQPRPLGALGGGAHDARAGQVPGAGVWPYGPNQAPNRRRG